MKLKSLIVSIIPQFAKYTLTTKMNFVLFVRKNRFIDQRDYNDIPCEELSLMDNERKKREMNKFIHKDVMHYIERMTIQEMKKIVREENLELLVTGNKKFKKNWAQLLPMIYEQSMYVFTTGIIKINTSQLYGQEDMVKYISEFF